MNKKLFCRHDWVVGEVLSYYYDHERHFVGNFRCKCSKCGKERETRLVVDEPIVIHNEN